MTKGQTGLVCVECGRNAVRGSMKHPYCKGCFDKLFDNDYKKYAKFMKETHASW